MNKQAKKLKQKRRAEKEALKNKKINEVWNDVEQYTTETGRKPLPKTKEQMFKVYNAKKI